MFGLYITNCCVVTNSKSYSHQKLKKKKYVYKNYTKHGCVKQEMENTAIVPPLVRGSSHCIHLQLESTAVENRSETRRRL